jgi:uncharacterized cupin superfamily protein
MVSTAQRAFATLRSFALSRTLTLIDDNGEHTMEQGSFARFSAGCTNAHHLVNRSNASAIFIAVGSRKPGEERIHYPDDAIGPIQT